MVAPKVLTLGDLRRTISRGIDEMELICSKAEENLNIKNDQLYRDTYLYDMMVSWRASQRSSIILHIDHSKEVVANIYGDILCDDVIGLTENTTELMESFLQHKLQVKVNPKN